MNEEFERFLKIVGGPNNAKDKLNGCSLVLIRSIRNGQREVSKQLAKQIIDKYPEISLSGLLYPENAA